LNEARKEKDDHLKILSKGFKRVYEALKEKDEIIKIQGGTA